MLCAEEQTGPVNHVILIASMQVTNLLASLDGAVHHSHIGDCAAEVIVVAVENHRLQRLLRITFGCWDLIDDRFDEAFDTNAGLRTHSHAVVGIDPSV